MANIKSAEKQARQALVRRDRNQQAKSAVRTTERKLRTLIAEGDKTKIEAALREFKSAISVAAQKGRIKKNTASRKIGRISKFVVKSAKEGVAPVKVAAKAKAKPAAKPATPAQ